jgi:hypothetical protein
MIIHELKHPTESISEMLNVFKKQLVMTHYALKSIQEKCARSRVPLLNTQAMLNERESSVR